MARRPGQLLTKIPFPHVSALPHGPVAVDAGGLAERLEVHEAAVRLVLEVFADEAELPVRQCGETWEVAG